jgi:hypothetical protein
MAEFSDESEGLQNQDSKSKVSFRNIRIKEIYHKQNTIQ